MKPDLSKAQTRKGDPLAKMTSSQNRSSSPAISQFNHSLSYKLNTRIRALRLAMGWSQTQLGVQIADYLKLPKPIPTSTIASWEHKDASIAKIPSPDKIEALANIFNVTVDYLKGFSDDPNRSAIEFMSSAAPIQSIEILVQELPQHMGEPIWITSDKYNGWMLLTEQYTLIDSKAVCHTVDELCEFNAGFSAFPPCHAYFRQVYNRFVIPETQIRNYYDRMWVCINSPDINMQNFNGWYTRTGDGKGVVGKTILSFDSYFDLWIAYTTPLTD